MGKLNINHLAIIMDGNQRWAKKNNQSNIAGYNAGLKKLNEVSELCINKNIKYLTVFALSTENIKRKNINLIFELILNNYQKFLKKLRFNDLIRINILGSKNNIPLKIRNIFNKIENENIDKKNILNLNIVFNYGIQEELIYIYDQLFANNYKKINYSIIKKYSYLRNIPDPDLLIRTGGHQRLSNFLLLNLSYTELFFTKTLWPDLLDIEINKILKNYNKRDKNYGL